MTDPHAAPAPLPTSPDLVSRVEKIVHDRLAFCLSQHTGSGYACQCPRDMAEAVIAATLAHLAAQAPDGVEELVYRLTDAVADVVDNPAGPYRIAAQVRRDEAKSALLAAFTALRGEVDHWKAEATVREERSEMWRNQFNNLRAATAANADHWDATEAALRQSLDAAVERAEAAEALARAAEGYIAVAVGDQDATAASLDAWRTYQHVKAALAPRGASDGSGPADREGR